MTPGTCTPPTRNKGWGFFGTMEQHAQLAWPLAIEAISKATGKPYEAVRVFLDAVPGRHFADDVHTAMHEGLTLAAAIDATAKKWMGWKTGAATRCRYGIPCGLPYLTAFVIHCEMTGSDG